MKSTAITLAALTIASHTLMAFRAALAGVLEGAQLIENAIDFDIALIAAAQRAERDRAEREKAAARKGWN